MHATRTFGQALEWALRWEPRNQILWRVRGYRCRANTAHLAEEARFWPWIAGRSPQSALRCCLVDRQRHTPRVGVLMCDSVRDSVFVSVSVSLSLCLSLSPADARHGLRRAPRSSGAGSGGVLRGGRVRCRNAVRSKHPRRRQLENHLQGYLAHKKHLPRRTLQPLCLGTYGGPRGMRVFYERGTPVARTHASAREEKRRGPSPAVVRPADRRRRSLLPSEYGTT